MSGVQVESKEVAPRARFDYVFGPCHVPADQWWYAQALVDHEHRVTGFQRGYDPRKDPAVGQPA